MKTLTSSRLSCLIAGLSIFLLFTTACEKEDKGDPVPVGARCTLLEENRSSSSGINNRMATVEYDANGRIASVTYTSSGQPKLVDRYERDTAGKISKMQTYQGADLVWEMTLEHDPKGKWKKVTTVTTGEVVLVAYEHDSQGNITKTTRTTEYAGRKQTSVNTYEYTNGNLTKMIQKYGGGVDQYLYEHQYVYKYYLDKPSFPLEYNSIYGLSYGSATPSKNLIKTSTMTRASEADFRDITNYTYKLNEAGMPIRVTSSSIFYQDGMVYDQSFDSLVVIRSYQCK